MSNLLCIYCVDFLVFIFFFCTVSSSTEIYTLSLHDALPICYGGGGGRRAWGARAGGGGEGGGASRPGRRANVSCVSVAVRLVSSDATSTAVAACVSVGRRTSSAQPLTSASARCSCVVLRREGLTEPEQAEQPSESQ